MPTATLRGAPPACMLKPVVAPSAWIGRKSMSTSPMEVSSCRISVSNRAFGYGIADGGELVPGGLFGPVAHGVFVGLAAGEDDVARAGLLDGEGDGLFAVVDLPEVAALDAALCGHGGGYLGGYVLHSLCARVLGGYDGEVGEAARDVAHEGALLTVAEARGAENDNHPAAAGGRQVAGELEGLFEGIGGVGEIDHHVEAEGPGLGDPLHAPAHLGDGGEAAGDGILGGAEGEGGGDGGQGVVDVVLAGQAHL